MARKKAYSLNYNIYSSVDRTAAIKEILDNLEETPNNTDLEQMADYILFGKDEHLLSSVDRKEILQPDRKFNSWKTKAEKLKSLDELLEDPVAATEMETKLSEGANKGPRYRVFKPEIHRPKYDEAGNIIDPGDSDVPGMIELWERIDVLQERLDMYKGKIPPNDYVRNHPMDSYRLYKFNHMLIDIRRHQYYLKDAYKPAIHFFNAQVPKKIEPNFNEPTGLWLSPEEWCGRKRNPKPFDLEQPALEDAIEREDGKLYWKISDNVINFEEPSHIYALLDNYVNLLKHTYDKPDSNTRMLLFTLEFYIEKANLTDVEQFILEQKVAHRNYFVIINALAAENIIMSETELRNTIRSKIPRKIAQQAKLYNQMVDLQNNRIEGLKCSKCKRTLPKTSAYFSVSRDKRTGFCSQCKECQKASRDARAQAKKS